MGGSNAAPEVVRAFAERHARSAFVNGLLWGALTLFLDHHSAPLQLFVVSLVIVASVGVSIYSLGPYPRAFGRYVHTIMALSLVAIVWTLWRAPQAGMSWALLFLTPLMWGIVTKLAHNYRKMVRTTLALSLEKEDLIASLKSQTQRAQHAMQVKSRFLASAAHDLRQPVHALALYAEWLQQEPDMAQEIIPKIRKSTQAVNALFDSLFDMARLDSGAMKPTRQPVHLGDMLDALHDEYSRAALEKGLTLRVRATNLTIDTDPIWLRRIVTNLISNAIRYTDQGGVLIAVRSRLEGRERRARLEVWDTGRGIAPADQTKVFDEFYRSGDSRGSELGFGLGLAIANRLSGLLGYHLTLRSVHGRGTMMRLDLGSAEQAQHSDTHLDPVTLLQGARIGIVEPNAALADRLCRALRQRRVHVQIEQATLPWLSGDSSSIPDVFVMPLDNQHPYAMPPDATQLRERFPECALVFAVDLPAEALRRHWQRQDIPVISWPIPVPELLTACADAFASAGEGSTEPPSLQEP
jgi:signal transduction histidine kinase